MPLNINHPLLLPTLFLVIISIILTSFPKTATSDNPCQYPCYPPPTGTTTTPTTTTPSPPSTIYSPPFYPTPTGYYPYNPPPTTFNGGGGYGYGPPPPDPILPYFPFYYKHGAHGDASSAFSSHLVRSTLVLVATANLLTILMFLLPS